MLKSISGIKDLTSFKDGEVLSLEKDLNFVFAYNGYGKSTVSRLINNWSSFPTFNYDDENLSSFNSENNYSIEFLDEDNNSYSELKALVFNKDYVDFVIQSNDFTDHKFSPVADVKENLSNPLKVEYYKVSQKLDTRSNAFSTEMASFEEKISNKLAAYKNMVDGNRLSKINLGSVLHNWKNPNKFDSKAIEKTGKEIQEKYLKIKEFSDDFKLNELVFNYDSFVILVDGIAEKLDFNEELSKSNYMSKISKNQQEWIVEGVEYIDGVSCPFCRRETIKDNDAINEYYSFVNSMINKYTIKLKMDSKKLEEIQRTTLVEFNSTISNIQEYIVFFNEETIKTFSESLTKFEKYINSLKTYIENKLSNMYQPVTIELNNKLVDNLNAEICNLNRLIVQFNIDIKKYLKQKAALKNEFLTEFAIPSIYIEFNESYNSLVLKQEKLNELQELYEEKKKEYFEDLKLKEPVSRLMNEILLNMNFTKYEVDHSFNLVFGKKHNVSSNVYTSLSEGEKTIISFALFLAKIQLEYDYLKDIDLVVIDDPISSLDYEKIYSISSIITSLFDYYKKRGVQFIVMTHNHVFCNLFTYRKQYNYIKIEKDENDKSFFITGSKALENSLYMNKLEIIKKVSELSSTELELNYKLSLHNHCRYVLESISKFMYPNNDGLNSLEEELKNIKKHNVDEFEFGKSKIETLFRLVNKGSHASVEFSHDMEGYHDQDYVIAAKTTIRIIEFFFPHQLD